MKKKKRKRYIIQKRRRISSEIKLLLTMLAAAVMVMSQVHLGNSDEPVVINRIPVQVKAEEKEPEPEPESEEETMAPGIIDPSKPMIALTFDDGPKSSVTDRILKSLADVGGRATFFMVGSNVSRNAKSVNQMVAQGCQVGNHTFGHKYITKLTMEEMLVEIGGTNQAVLDACGILPTVVRPPGGYTDEASLQNLAAMGMPAVMWSIDTKDWQHRNPQMTIEAVLGQVKDGDIILMHDIYSTTADAVEILIPALVEQGFQLVTVGELASYRGGMVPGQQYGRFYP